MSSKKSTPKSSVNPKDTLMRLFSCGSGKKEKLPVGLNAPLEPSQEVDNTPVSREVRTVPAMRILPSREEEEVELSYTDIKTIGKGTFGVVYRVRLCQDSDVVALKKVFDDKRYKNRELLFLKQLDHPNITNLVYYFYTEDAGCRKGERYLNMMLEYVPETLFSIAKCDGTYTKPLLEPLYIKVYMYQMFRCLNYLHSQNVCHRDIKPQNLLIDPSSHMLKLCDFGSAKELLKNESNVAYICSRYYRAPELIFGVKDYNCQIDMWSGGCVLGELFQGHPLFPGATGPDQLVEIMKVLGTPTYEDILDINRNANMRLPPVLVPMPWHKIFTKQTLSYDAIDLVSKLLVFSPKRRILPLDACAHPFFNELRTRGVRLPDGSPLPPLFNFTNDEVKYCPDIKERLLPAGWDDDWGVGGTYAPQNRDLQSDKDDGSIKNKLVKLARNSFKKNSFKRDHHSPSYGIEIEGTRPGVQSEVDLSELALGARQKLDREDASSFGGGEVEFENVSHEVVDLSIKATPERQTSERKKKKKKKQRMGSMEDLDSQGNDESPEATLRVGGQWDRSPKPPTFNELDSAIPFSTSRDEDSFVETSNERKSKKVKKNRSKPSSGDFHVEDVVVDPWAQEVEDMSHDALRALSSSTPADLDEAVEVKVVKKKIKKQKSRDDSVRGSFEDLDSGLSPAHDQRPNGSTRRAGKKSAKNKQTIEYSEQTGYDDSPTGRVVRTVVTKTTTSEEGPRRTKKKTTRHYDVENEV